MEREGNGDARLGSFARDESASWASGTPPNLLPSLTVSTNGVPLREQFAFWQATMAPHLEMWRPHGVADDPFRATSTAWRFGSLVLSRTRLPPCSYRRSASHIRRDSLDHWIVMVCRGGEQRQRSGDQVTEMRQATPYVFSMSEGFEAERCGAEMDVLALYVPRDSAADIDAPLAALRNRAVDGALGSLLADHVVGLEASLPRLQESEGARLAQATLAVLGAAVTVGADLSAAAAPQMAELQLARLKRLIRQNLGAATLGPARLCALAGISRSQLYRLFEPSGGVARHIQAERLRAAYRLLVDPAERRSIAQVAEAVGFFEPSSFSRAFRAEFGCTPRELRQSATGAPPHAGRRGMQVQREGGFAALLRAL